jgi:hypothetical protein
LGEAQGLSLRPAAQFRAGIRYTSTMSQTPANPVSKTPSKALEAMEQVVEIPDANISSKKSCKKNRAIHAECILLRESF